jgi:hypothetical protein
LKFNAFFLGNFGSVSIHLSSQVIDTMKRRHPVVSLALLILIPLLIGVGEVIHNLRLRDQLCEAVRVQDDLLAAKLLERGVPADRRGLHGKTALEVADEVGCEWFPEMVRTGGQAVFPYREKSGGGLLNEF